MPLSLLSALVGLFTAVSLHAAGVPAPSVVAVDGQKADCHGTFIFSGRFHDLLALPASCLQNVETGGVRVVSEQSKSVRSVGVAIHPYLQKSGIYDMAKVPPSFDFAVALFPKGTAQAVSPVSREYAQSLSGYFSENKQAAQSFFPDFQKTADKSATDMEPDTSVMPGAPIFDATNRGVVAIGLGCSQNGEVGSPRCMAVSLHDSLSRDVLAAAKKRYPDSLAALELPTKTHQLGHLGLFCRRRSYCVPRCTTPTYNNSCNRSYSYNPTTNQTQQTQMYARGPGSSAGNSLSPNAYSRSQSNSNSDARSNSNASASNRSNQSHSDSHHQQVEASNNSNTTTNANPTNTSNPTNTFNPTFNPTIHVSPSIVVSPVNTSSADRVAPELTAPVIPVSYTPPAASSNVSSSADAEAAARLAFERHRESERNRENERMERMRNEVREQQSEIARERERVQNREIELRAQSEANNALKTALAQQRNEAIAQARAAEEENNAVRDRLTQELARVRSEREELARQTAELAEQRRQAEVSRQTDQADELRQKLDPQAIQAVTGEEPPPPPIEPATPGQETSLYRPALQRMEKRDLELRSMIASNVNSLDTRQAVAGTVSDRARMLAASTPFRSGEQGPRGMSIAAFDALKSGRAPSTMVAVVRSAQPFLGAAPEGLVADAQSENGLPLLAVYVPR